MLIQSLTPFIIVECYFFPPDMCVSDALNIPVIILQLYRHGDRTPVASYPTDPYNNVSYWPNGWGQLTNVRF